MADPKPPEPLEYIELECAHCATDQQVDLDELREALSAHGLHIVTEAEKRVGYGKDESCQFEGPWRHMAVLAAKILRHPNTQKVAPNLYQPDIALTPEQEDSY